MANRTDRADLVVAVLSVLSAANAGASNLRETLISQGFHVSEPTVARLLRELDRDGSTLPSGNQGRVLTDVGRAHLGRLEDTRHRHGSVRQIVDQLRFGKLDDLVNILIARRGIEREIGRAAAANANERDIAELKRQVELIRVGRATDMHDLLAQAAHNAVLEALYHALARDPGMKRLHGEISERRRNPDDVSFARRLADAIARRDAHKAEQMIVRHLDEMIEVATEYWREIRTRSRAKSQRENFR